MNDILTELSKPVWWVSVVVAGIAINLLSAYLKGSVDKALTGTSSWWRRRSSARQLAWQARIDLLRSNEQARHAVAASEVRLRLQSIHMLLLAIFIVLLPMFMATSGLPLPRLALVFVLGAFAIVFFMSFLAFRAGGEMAVVLREALKKANPLREPPL